MKIRFKVINELSAKGANVIFQDAHGPDMPIEEQTDLFAGETEVCGLRSR